MHDLVETIGRIRLNVASRIDGHAGVVAGSLIR
jgi:hypothetical protein